MQHKTHNNRYLNEIEWIGDELFHQHFTKLNLPLFSVFVSVCCLFLGHKNIFEKSTTRNVNVFPVKRGASIQVPLARASSIVCHLLADSSTLLFRVEKILGIFIRNGNQENWSENCKFHFPIEKLSLESLLPPSFKFESVRRYEKFSGSLQN